MERFFLKAAADVQRARSARLDATKRRERLAEPRRGAAIASRVGCRFFLCRPVCDIRSSCLCWPACTAAVPSRGSFVTVRPLLHRTVMNAPCTALSPAGNALGVGLAVKPYHRRCHADDLALFQTYRSRSAVRTARSADVPLTGTFIVHVDEVFIPVVTLSRKFSF